MIVSAESDPDVLVRSPDNGGFLNYMQSVSFTHPDLTQSAD